MVRAWVIAHRVDLLQHLVDCGNSTYMSVSMVDTRAAPYRAAGDANADRHTTVARTHCRSCTSPTLTSSPSSSAGCPASSLPGLQHTATGRLSGHDGRVSAEGLTRFQRAALKVVAAPDQGCECTTMFPETSSSTRRSTCLHLANSASRRRVGCDRSHRGCRFKIFRGSNRTSSTSKQW